MASLEALREDDDLIRETMKASPERVDILVTGTRMDRHPVERIIREKDDMGATITRVEPVLDPKTGEPAYNEIEIVEYDVIRDGIKCGGECRLDQILSVDTRKASDDYAGNIAKRRAAEIIEQLDRIRGGHETVLPDGHLSLEKWGGVNKHVIAVLRANRIYSVQQVRDLSEAQVARLPGGIHANRLRDEARAFLLRKQDELTNKASERLQREIAETRQENAELRGMLTKLLKKMGLEDEEEEADATEASSDQSDTEKEVAPDTGKTGEDPPSAEQMEAARAEVNAQRHEANAQRHEANAQRYERTGGRRNR